MGAVSFFIDWVIVTIIDGSDQNIVYINVHYIKS